MFYSAVLAGVLATMLISTAAGAAPATATPEEAFRQAFPQVKMESIQETDIKGLYEVISGQNLLYYYPEHDYIFVGEIFNKQSKNLTAERRGKIMAGLARDLPLEKAVRIGNGKKVVIEITDPDCDFCRAASKYLAGKTNLTRYVFFAPIAHPAAINKIHYILGAADKPHAYEEMMGGRDIPPTAPVVGAEIISLARDHLSLARKIGVRGTPTFFINGHTVVGADIEKLEQLLKD